MDLGLHALSDDQLLELLAEATAEVGQRDPVIRGLAQKQIYAEAERVKLYKESIGEAIEWARESFEQNIKAESLTVVREAMARGDWSPLSSTEEALAVINADREVKSRLIAEAQKALATPTGPNLWLHIQPGCVKASYTGSSGQRQTDSVGRISQGKIDAVIAALRAVLGV